MPDKPLLYLLQQCLAQAGFAPASLNWQWSEKCRNRGKRQQVDATLTLNQRSSQEFGPAGVIYTVSEVSAPELAVVSRGGVT